MYIEFVDLEKAFDRVPKTMVWWALKRKGAKEREVLAISEMYRNITIPERIDGERLKEFEIKVGIQHGSFLSTF